MKLIHFHSSLGLLEHLRTSTLQSLPTKGLLSHFQQKDTSVTSNKRTLQSLPTKGLFSHFQHLLLMCTGIGSHHFPLYSSKCWDGSQAPVCYCKLLMQPSLCKFIQTTPLTVRPRNFLTSQIISTLSNDSWKQHFAVSVSSFYHPPP
jgi:hypothetical protein